MFVTLKGIIRRWIISFICLFLGDPEDHKVIYSRNALRSMLANSASSLASKAAAQAGQPTNTQPDHNTSLFGHHPKYATRSKYERCPEYVRRALRNGIRTEEEAANIPLKPNLGWRRFLCLRNRLTKIEFYEAIWDNCSKYYCMRMHRYLMATPIVDLTDEEFDLIARHFATKDNVNVTAEFFERNAYTILHSNVYDINEHPLSRTQKRLLKRAARREPNPDPNAYFKDKAKEAVVLTPAEFNARNHYNLPTDYDPDDAPNEEVEDEFLDLKLASTSGSNGSLISRLEVHRRPPVVSDDLPDDRNHSASGR